MNTTSCTNCVFFDDATKQAAAASATEAGVCRFNPPAPQAGSEAKSLWPVVTAEDWCGHFTAQRAAARAA
ncbi:hypothetical protein FHS82_003493 [Pseudochelatococcus lubricantis]|uniref:Uncharacterized protein n=1 Tax=Pseudochelatococcus lubricantis TaxID=1538102 RepID=A0ABX0V782_9HYPH|nr:hypothetical protein [Pseudochelatococcus lubricantis]NIJ59635.1 hypothetical protein [Pseudochelatococcus lubricantis]